MENEPNIKSDKISEGTVVADKDRKESPYAYLKDWHLREWLWGIVSLAVCVAMLVMSDEIPHISRLWSWAIRIIALLGFSYIIGLINKTKKKNDF